MAGEEVRRRIARLFTSDPSIDAAHVRLSIANGGKAVLDGYVHTYPERCRIEELASRDPEITAVENALDVRLTIGDYRTDATLRRVLTELIEALARMPADLPRVTVTNGWVTLEGHVPFRHQKVLVERAVREVAGVRGIRNEIVAG